MASLPAGVRGMFPDEVPDMPQVCTYPDHGSFAHKHEFIGKTWFYKPRPHRPPQGCRCGLQLGHPGECEPSDETQ